ncbi:matrin-3 isoform X2 [Xenopus laevis]|uniref:Matrin-3 isoform X2 n=1 Tax=Xenopus laevis TaxID=8355 RepID=A0A8J0U9E8_XENLA|nr:matrin-3 isoform X2 [Xenopus laevis]
MSKSFQQSSLSRDLQPHHRRDTTGTGLLTANQSLSIPSSLGRMNQGTSRIASLMSCGTISKLSQPGSHLSSSSSHSLPSVFSLGARTTPLSSSLRGDSDPASKILASFGLSSRDLDELSRYPEEKITPENLPQILSQLKRRRSESIPLVNYRDGRSPREQLRVPSEEWEDERTYRRGRFDDRLSSLNSVVDYDHGNHAQESNYRDRMEFESDRLRENKRVSEDNLFRDPPYQKFEDDYERLRFSRPQERAIYENNRGYPSSSNIEDFHGLLPKNYPHVCSICDMPVHSKQDWTQHVSGPTHRRRSQLLLEIYPDWNPDSGHGVGDPYVLHQSTNPAPGILGPPPPGLNMGGGQDGGRRSHRGHLDLGNEDIPGARSTIRDRQDNSRVVHVMDFQRGNRLRYQLLQLAEPFGEIINHLILKKKNEAFIEMSTSDEALAVVDYYRTNTALVFGQPVRVHLSQKYKRIMTPGDNPEPRPDVKPDVGLVLHLSNLPHSGYSDSAVVKLAEAYGKVKTYILMRKKTQAFIEMEKEEDVQAMIEQCERNPLWFQGKHVKVELSGKYKRLVLRIPNKAVDQIQKDKSRKRAHSPEQKKEGSSDKKVVKKEGSLKAGSSNAESNLSSASVKDKDKSSPEKDSEELCKKTEEETEQQELVTVMDESDYLVDEDGEEAAGTLLETSSSVGDDVEQQYISDPNFTEMEVENKLMKNPASVPGSTEAAHEKLKKRLYDFPGNIEDFVTLDEVGDEEDLEGQKIKSSFAETVLDSTPKINESLTDIMASTSVDEPEPESEHDNEATVVKEEEIVQDSAEMPGNLESHQSENSVEQSNVKDLLKDYTVGPYLPDNPVGIEYVVPKTGFYCKLCSLFYTNEEVAKVTHCSSLPHYQKLKKLMNKMAKNLQKKD